MKSVFTFIVLLLLGSSCVTNQTISFLNDDVDLRDYETFWLISLDKENELSVDGLIFYSQLEKAILDNMDKRLFNPSKTPDLIVRYELVSGQRTQTSQTYNYYNPYSYYMPTRTINYAESILIIEFRDRKKKKLVWQGSLDMQFRQGKPDEIIVDAVNEIFETYPYRAGSYEKIPMDKK